MDKIKKLNVLIVAHELSPYQGSECAEGWNIIKRLGDYHNLTVLYARGSQADPEKYQKDLINYFDNNEEIPNVKFVNVAQPKITMIISRVNLFLTKKKSIGSPFLYFIGYSFWQRSAYNLASELHLSERFEIAHQLTAISFREPGYLWKLNIPFIWGPTGGTEKLPFSFYAFLTFKSKMFELLRRFTTSCQFHLSYKVNKALRKAYLIYLISNSDAEHFKTKTKAKLKLMTDAGSYSIENFGNAETKIPLKILWIGRLEERKAVKLFLESIKRLESLKDKFSVTIIGSGHQEDFLCSSLRELNQFEITWVKKVAHDQIFDLMKKADLFVHTSYREATTHVIPEALSLGLPVICHKICGMDIAINDSCGIKIDLNTPEESIIGFRNAMESLIIDISFLDRLKKGARKRADEISWDSIVREIANDYIEIYHSFGKCGLIE